MSGCGCDGGYDDAADAPPLDDRGAFHFPSDELRAPCDDARPHDDHGAFLFPTDEPRAPCVFLLALRLARPH